MRTTVAVLFLLVGFWSLVGGGCTAGCSAGAKLGADRSLELAEQLQGLVQRSSDAPADPRAAESLRREVAVLAADATEPLWAGLAVLLAAVLAVVAAVRLLQGHGRAVATVAAAVGIAAELLWIGAVGVPLLSIHSSTRILIVSAGLKLLLCLLLGLAVVNLIRHGGE